MAGHPLRLILSVATVTLTLALPVLPDVTRGVHAQGQQSGAKKAAVPIDESPELMLQVLLDRAGFSPGEIDGVSGANTTRAVTAYRQARNVSGTGAADVLRALQADSEPILTTYRITSQDAAGPFVPEIPTDMMEKAKLPALGYTSVLEMIAERTHAAPELLRALNPEAKFVEGEEIRVPNITRPLVPLEPTAPGSAAAKTATAASRVVVSKAGSGLTVYGQGNEVLFFAPVTSGSEHDPLPIGTWKVNGVSRNPTFNYNPDLFWDADPAHAKTKIPAGPNGPVGTVWIDISKPHYGLHGTPEPGKVGHTASHGCVRLTNWDAQTLAGFVRAGTVVIFEQ